MHSFSYLQINNVLTTGPPAIELVTGYCVKSFQAGSVVSNGTIVVSNNTVSKVWT